MKTYKKGISLIVLVITVIVLAILAATLIITISNSNIINKEKESINKYNSNSIKEMIEFYKSSYLLEDSDEITEAEFIQQKLNRTGNEKLGDQVYLRSQLRVGDYINYLPSTGSYSVVGGEFGSGYESTQHFTTDSDLIWRVYNINEDYSVDIVPVYYPNISLYLDGAAGANNGVEILNDLCENLYSNLSLGIVARSINIEDINKKTEYTYIEYGTTPISVASRPEYAYPTVWKYDYGSVASSREHSVAKIDKNGVYSYSIGETSIINKSDLDQTLLYYWSLNSKKKNEDFYVSWYLREDLGKNNLPGDIMRYLPRVYVITINGIDRYFAIIDRGLTVHDIRRNPDMCMDIDYSNLPNESGNTNLKEKCIEVVNTKQTVDDEKLTELDSYSFSGFFANTDAWISTKWYSVDLTGYEGSVNLENIHIYTLRNDDKIQGCFMYQADGSTYYSRRNEYFHAAVIPVVNIPVQINLKDTGHSDYVRNGYTVYEITK